MSGKCSEEINTKEKDVETRRIGNSTPSFSRRTHKFKGQQKIETSSVKTKGSEGRRYEQLSYHFSFEDTRHLAGPASQAKSP